MKYQRIKLRNGKQRELVECAKDKIGSWKSLSNLLEINEHYLKYEIRGEIRTLSKLTYERLCSIVRKNYNMHIIKILNHNWGRLKGAKLSPRTKIKKIDRIKPSIELAEIIGIMLGDGNIYKKQYAVRICGNLKTDRKYLLVHVKNLFKKVFGTKPKEYYHKSMNEIILYIYNKFVACNLEYYGIKSGNKINNGSEIPEWILKNRKYIIPCIRGLFDTDGSVFFAKNKIKIELYSGIENLQKSTERAMKILGFNKTWKNKNKRAQTYGLYSKEDTKRFINIIGFNNPKHSKKCSGSVAA